MGRFSVRVASILFLVTGVLIGYLVSYENPVNNDCSINLALAKNPEHPFIQPLLRIITPKSCDMQKLAPLRDAIARVASAQPKGTFTRYAYYFRDLTDSSWTGINETDQYDPGSMLKVVVALAVYKQEEITHGFLASRLTYTQDLANMNAAFPFAPSIALKVGQSYPVPFLLKEMLSDSDNAAKDLLLASLDQVVIDGVYTDLSIKKPDSGNSAGYMISPFEYSRFLRVLYYSLYDLSWKDANALLELLNGATFTQGIVAGVPSGVSVAHKYGEHVNGTGKEISSVELSDCGIVYHPERPYLICVMTEGKDPDMLARFIAQVSRATYTEVKSGYR